MRNLTKTFTAFGRRDVRSFSGTASLYNDEYQYLQRSILNTYHFQKSLPHLPVPSLQETCLRYLAAQKPLLDAAQYKKTESYAQEFLDGIGKQLHEKLEERDSRHPDTSYISEPWFDMYLRDRQSIVLNYNPFMAFVDDPKPEYNKQDIRATNFLVSALRFMKSLRQEMLEPEVYHMNPKKSDTEKYRKWMKFMPYFVSTYASYAFKAYPLDMSQFSSLFNSTRIPFHEKDKLWKDESARHILLMRNGHFFVFDVLDKDGNILSPSDIYACVNYITSQNISPASHPLGILTSENRDVWASVREKLVESGNEEQLRLIDSAFFNLVLDDEGSGNDPEKMVRTFLHGNGTNRWFDKSFSLILTKDGKAAVNFEHSWGDGVAVMRFFNEIFADSTKAPRVHPNDKISTSLDPSKHVRRLDFNLNEEIKHAIGVAKEKFQAATGRLGVNLLQSDALGKKFCKEQKVSPDAMMQLGFQVAYHRLTGKTVATYESCSTSAFRKGRTETIRPATRFTKAFSEANNSGNAGGVNLSELIYKCSEYHGQLTKEAAMGQGFDRHLFAMRYYCQDDLRIPMPDIYTDPAYAALNHNVLSTSTLSSPAVLLGGFGAVVQDGFGIGYSIMDNELGAVVTSYPPNSDAAGFVDCLEKAYKDIHGVLNKSSTKQ